MIDIRKQIDYWQSGSMSDFETAEILVANKKFIDGLFFCHLSIEKILKALFVKETGEAPPKSHNLNYIQEIAKVEVTEQQRLLMSVLMKYQLEGRYPDYRPDTPSFDIINDYLSRTKELLICLRQKL